MTARERLPTGARTSSRRDPPRIDDKSFTTLCAARVASKRIASAKSQRFDRPSITLWRAVGVRAECRRLASKTGSGADRPSYGKIKAARCGPVGWLDKVEISEARREVHFRSAALIFEERKKDQFSAHLARAVAWGTSAACRGVARRVLRPFCSALVSWHAATMACPHKPCQFTGHLRSLARGLVGGPGRKK